MAGTEAPAAHPLPGKLPIAEPGRRVLAHLVDLGLLAALSIALHLMLNAAFDLRSAFADRPVLRWCAMVLGVSLPAWIYFTLCEGSVGGQTVGKRLLRVRVVMLDGGPLSYGRAFLRTLIKFAPWELVQLVLLLPPKDVAAAAATAETAARELSRLQSIGLVFSTLLFGGWLGATLLTPKAQSVHDLAVRSLVLRAGREAEG